MEEEITMAKKKKKRAERGSGTFRTRSNGTIEYRITYKDEFGLSKRKSFSGSSEEECYQKYEKFLEDQQKLMKGIDVYATIPQIIEERYKLDYRLNYVGEQGFSRNMETLNILKRSMIAHIPIAEITKQHLLAYLASITHYSNSVIQKCFQQLKMAFNEAKEQGIIEKNIITDREIKCPKSDKPDKKVRGYTPEEQKCLVEAITNHKVPYGRNNYKLQLLVELYTGMRMGEINALRPDDVDFDRNVIHIRRTISKGANSRAFIKEGTKTYAGSRTVPMSKDARDVLSQAIAEMKRNPENLIFYDHNKNDIVTTNQVNGFFKRLCEKHGILFNGQHALRHTFATRCIESDIQPVVLKTWLGHTDIHITLDTYSDVFDGLNHESITKFDNHINSI